MPPALAIFFILALGLALQSGLSLQAGRRFVRFVRRSLSDPPGDYHPPAALIVPCKGLEAEFDAHITHFLTQAYPDYQVIFVVASPDDPAYRHLRERLEGSGSREPSTARKKVLIVAGHSDRRGEKVNNLLHGLSAVDRHVEVLAFADADARMRSDWLQSLVAPLGNSAVTASTGFRWYLPGRSVGSQIRAAWDTSIAMILGDHPYNFAWGGSTAMRAADFRRLKIAERYWQATVSDDYAITSAVREAGGHIRFEPRCLVASREECTLGQFLRWANRQIILTRVYAPRLWLLGLACHSFFAGTLLYGLVLAAALRPVAFKLAVGLILGVILGLGLAKAGLRSRLAREIFPEEKALLERYGSCYWVWWPLVPWIMLVNFLTAGVVRRIEWRGVHYELKSGNEVRVLVRNRP